jgi:23S rRNA pseudouridine1911/1915/1917 synthase
MTIEILFEDNHCLAVNKPAGLLSQGDETGDPDLVSWARGHLKERHAKPGNVYVGLVHRLDRPTSGVLLLARTSKAAGRLSEQFRAGHVSKVYWAVVEGLPDPPHGQWQDVLEKDRAENRSRVRREAGSEATGRVARVEYRTLAKLRGQSLLELRPETGRSHQLRVQLSDRALPIVGDRKYGASSVLRAADGHHRIALHARELSFTHPTRAERIVVTAPLPEDWPREHSGWGPRGSGEVPRGVE